MATELEQALKEIEKLKKDKELLKEERDRHSLDITQKKVRMRNVNSLLSNTCEAWFGSWDQVQKDRDIGYKLVVGLRDRAAEMLGPLDEE